MGEQENEADLAQPRAVWFSSEADEKTRWANNLQEKIEDIFGHINTFKTIDGVEKYLKDSEQVFLITTNDCCNEILQKNLHDAPALEAIFIYNPTKKKMSSCNDQFFKVEGIYTQSKDLINNLSMCFDRFSKNRGILISTLKQNNPEMTVNIINNYADYAELWYPLFLDLLFALPTLDESARKEQMINFTKQCRRFYAHYPERLVEVNEFLSPSGGYSPKEAVKFYTKDYFLYKRVNKALRQQNFQAILDFQFFLLDMKSQLQQAYGDLGVWYNIGDEMKFWRGQLTSKKELEELQEKRISGSLITVNSYVSCSRERSIGLIYAGQHSISESFPALYEITAEFRDPQVMRSKPFAYIGNLSHFGHDESEVLFSVGSFFRVDDVAYSEKEKLHLIKLTFIYDEDHSTITDDYNSLRSCSMEEKLIKTGYLLSNRSKAGCIKAEAFYQRFLTNHPTPNIQAACHIGLGWLALKENQYSTALSEQEKALELCQSLSDVDHLCANCYNCIGNVYAEQKEYSKALSYYLKTSENNATIIPIDKYAFYNCFRNVASVNIASIYKIQGHVDMAWSTYKVMLATEMKTSNLLHAATYLKIAEAGFANKMKFDNEHEKFELMDNWKRFLNLSLADMSSCYRRSIVSGVLSIGLQFENNDSTRDIAIDYYKQIIKNCERFIQCSLVDYGIVIKCYQNIAQLYQNKCSFVMSIQYAVQGLKLCKLNNLDYIIGFYEIMAGTFEKNLELKNTSLSPEDIDHRLGVKDGPNFDQSFLGSFNQLHSEIILYFDPSEFQFGQYKKKLNPKLLEEHNLKRCLAHCLLKLAAFREEQQQTRDKFYPLLLRASALLPHDMEVQSIVANNCSYLEGKFQTIIRNYERELSGRRQQTSNLCIGEEAFCYLGHLYEKLGDTESSKRWYMKAIDYFEGNRFLCVHTRLCFVIVASFYQKQNDLPSTVQIYQRLLQHLIQYRQDVSSFQREIVVLLEHLLQHWRNEPGEQIYLLKHLIELMVKPVDSEEKLRNQVDDEIQLIIKRFEKRKEHQWVPVFIYESYLEIVVKHHEVLLTPCVQTTIPICHKVANVYKYANDPQQGLAVYQNLINRILKSSNDRFSFVVLIKELCLHLERNEHFKAAMKIYEELYQFISRHPAPIQFPDNDLIMYILTRYDVAANSGKEPRAAIYRKKIDIFRSYRENLNPKFDLKLYLETLESLYTKLATVEPPSAFASFDSLLELFLKHQPFTFDQLLAKIVALMKDQPRQLLNLLVKYHLEYSSLIRMVSRLLALPLDSSLISFEPFPVTKSPHLNNIMAAYHRRATNSLKSADMKKKVIECWTECIYFLLEFASQYDEYLADCYRALNDPVRAANIFDPLIYKDLAVKYCPNACRRYLKFVYRQTTAQEELEQLFVDHFHLINSQREIRPLEEVKY